MKSAKDFRATSAKTKPTNKALNVCYDGPYGTPVAHVQYLEERHLHVERIPFRRNETPVSVRLLDLSKESMDNLRVVALTMKRVTASNLQLQSIPDHFVLYLLQLQRLDLSKNRLTDLSFPDSMRSLEKLKELRLNDNLLTRIPACVQHMRKLSRLDLSNNHLCNLSGLDRLRKLKFLMLDNNRLTTNFKEISGMRMLEMLRCSNNLISEVHREIKNIIRLEELDVSNNRLTTFPIELFLLPKLDVLKANVNQFVKVPSFNPNIHQTQKYISMVDFSDNNITMFPGHLMCVAKKLDLSNNKIRTLPRAAFQKIIWDRDKELLVTGNPLSYPPQDVCEYGLKTIINFFHNSQAEVKTYQGVKVLVVGSSQCGKSSLIQSLIDQQSRLVEDSSETATGIEVYEYSLDFPVEEGEPGKSLNLCLWDFCGHPFYLFPQSIFIHQPAISILSFSLQEYTADNFSVHIASWVDWTIAKTNQLVIILVGTKSDKVPAAQIKEITQDARDRLTAHLKSRQALIESRIRSIEKLPVISPTISDELKDKIKLLQAKFVINEEVVVTSSKDFLGFDNLLVSIKAVACDRDIFPNVMRPVPVFWVEVENWLEERSSSMTIPVWSWQEYSDQVTRLFGMKHLLTTITRYLHETGKVVWLSDANSLRKIIFLRPSWLFNVIKLVLRHDISSFTLPADDIFKATSITALKFDLLKQGLLNEGCIDLDLLKCLLYPMFSSGMIKSYEKVLHILTNDLELGYLVSQTLKSVSSNSSVDNTGGNTPPSSLMFVPWLCKNSVPAFVHKKWSLLEERCHVTVQYRFPCYMPPGLFELFSTHVQLEKYKWDVLSQWSGGFYVQHVEETVQLLAICYCKDIYCENVVERHFCQAQNGDNEVFLNTDKNLVGGTQSDATTNDTDSVSIASPTLCQVDKPYKSSIKQLDFQNVEADRAEVPLPRYDAVPYVSEPTITPFHDTSDLVSKTVVTTLSENDSDTILENASQSYVVESNSSHSGIPTIDSNSIIVRQPENTIPFYQDYAYAFNTNISCALPERHDHEKKVYKSQNDIYLNSSETLVKNTKTFSGDRSRGVSEQNHTDDMRFTMQVCDSSETHTSHMSTADMWKVLLPLLVDFEELLLRFKGVVVERHVLCPFCGYAAFDGEWLTSKDTRTSKTRTCDACGEEVDASRLAPLREKTQVLKRRIKYRPDDVVSHQR